MTITPLVGETSSQPLDESTATQPTPAAGASSTHSTHQDIPDIILQPDEARLPFCELTNRRKNERNEA